MFDISQVQTLLSMLGETLAVSATIAVSVLAGYAVYQLAVIASWIYFARFVVTKIYELINKNIERPKEYTLTLGGRTAVKADNEAALQELAAIIQSKLALSSYGWSLPSEIKELTAYINKYAK